MVTVDHSMLQKVTAGYRVVKVGYSRLPSGYSVLQKVTEWLQWDTADNSR